MALPITTNLRHHHTAKLGKTLTTGKVTQWDDQSSVLAHVTVPSGSAGPEDLSEDSLPFLRFNGTDTILRYNGSDLPDLHSSNKITCYLYVRTRDEGSSQYSTIMTHSQPGTTNRGRIINYQTAGIRARNGSGDAIISMDNGVWRRLTVMFEKASETGWTGALLRVEGVDVTPANDVGLSTGSGLSFGANGEEVSLGDFDLREAITYTAKHTTSEMESMEAYLTDEWAPAVFEITNPSDLESVTQPFNLEVSNPNAVQGFYKQISKTAPDVNDDLSSLVKDITATSTSSSISGLDAATHYLKSIEITQLGGQSDEKLFSDIFDRADNATDWGSDYSNTEVAGVTDIRIVNNTGILELDASSRIFQDILGPDATDCSVKFDVTYDNVSTDYQPTYHFRTQGAWSSNKIHSYWVWLNGTDVNLGRTSSGYGNIIFDTKTFTRTAGVKYTHEIEIEGFDIDVWIYASTDPRPETPIISYTDTDQISSQGNVSIHPATTASSGTAEKMTFTLVEYTFLQKTPQITNIDVAEDSASISYDTISFDNEGYEVRYRTVGGTFGAWINIGYTNPYTISPLATGDYEAQISAMHNGQRSDLSDIVPFTIATASVSNMVISPASPELEDEQGSTVTLSRTLDSTGGASKSTMWSITQQPANGSISIKSQTDSDCTLEAGSGLVITDPWKVKAVADFDGVTEDEVTGTVVDAPELVIEGSQAEDIATLEALALSANYQDWNNNTGWATSGMTLDPAPYGVETETIGSVLRVVSLKLDGKIGWKSGREREIGLAGPNGGNNLVGGLPQDWSLGQCVYLNLKHNYLGQKLPPTLINQNLEYLRLQGPREGSYDKDVTDNYNPGKIGDSWRTNTFIDIFPKVPTGSNLKLIEAQGRFGSELGDSDIGIEGKLTNTLNNAAGLQLVAVSNNRFTDFPDDLTNTSLILYHIGPVHRDSTGNRTSRGCGTSRLATANGLLTLKRVILGKTDAGSGTTDNQFPNMSGCVNMTTFQVNWAGIKGPVPAWLYDGTIKGVLDGGISSFAGGVNDYDGGLEDPGYDYGFTHRFGRSVLTLTNSGLVGPWYPGLMDPAVINFNISGNSMDHSTWPPKNDLRNLQRIRNFFIAGNNFSGWLSMLDWFSHTRQYTDHNLSSFSRITIGGTSIRNWNVPKEAWELQQKTCVWYYRNKNNLMSNVDTSFTLGDAKAEGYSSSFITNTLGTSSWNDGDSAETFFQTITDKIFSGWANNSDDPNNWNLPME